MPSFEATPATVLAAGFVAAGAGLLPDADHHNATIRHSPGGKWMYEITKAYTFGRHRGWTHSLMWAFLVALVAGIALPVVAGGVAIAMGYPADMATWIPGLLLALWLMYLGVLTVQRKQRKIPLVGAFFTGEYGRRAIKKPLPRVSALWPVAMAGWVVGRVFALAALAVTAWLPVTITVFFGYVALTDWTYQARADFFAGPLSVFTVALFVGVLIHTWADGLTVQGLWHLFAWRPRIEQGYGVGWGILGTTGQDPREFIGGMVGFFTFLALIYGLIAGAPWVDTVAWVVVAVVAALTIIMMVAVPLRLPMAPRPRAVA